MRPETKALYPDNWAEISRATIEAADHTCKDCRRCSMTENIILITHHKDYDPSNNKKSNRVCLCQGCHLRRQARDLAEAIKYLKIMTLILQGQSCFQGMEPIISKRLSRVVTGKALATSQQTAVRARRDTGQSE